MRGALLKQFFKVSVDDENSIVEWGNLRKQLCSNKDFPYPQSCSLKLYLHRTKFPTKRAIRRLWYVTRPISSFKKSVNEMVSLTTLSAVVCEIRLSP